MSVQGQGAGNNGDNGKQGGKTRVVVHVQPKSPPQPFTVQTASGGEVKVVTNLALSPVPGEQVSDVQPIQPGQQPAANASAVRPGSAPVPRFGAHEHHSFSQGEHVPSNPASPEEQEARRLKEETEARLAEMNALLSPVPTSPSGNSSTEESDDPLRSPARNPQQEALARFARRQPQSPSSDLTQRPWGGGSLGQSSINGAGAGPAVGQQPVPVGKASAGNSNLSPGSLNALAPPTPPGAVTSSYENYRGSSAKKAPSGQSVQQVQPQPLYAVGGFVQPGPNPAQTNAGGAPANAGISGGANNGGQQAQAAPAQQPQPSGNQPGVGGQQAMPPPPQPGGNQPAAQAQQTLCCFDLCRWPPSKCCL